MDKFWKWMVDNYYCDIEYYDECYAYTYRGYFIPNTRAIEFSNTSLIGYMIEYLRLKGKFIGLASNKGFETIESYYNSLKNEIDNLED